MSQMRKGEGEEWWVRAMGQDGSSVIVVVGRRGREGSVEMWLVIELG